MPATRALPEQYSLAWSLDLRQNRRLNLILQGFGLLGALLFWAGFTWLLVTFRPEIAPFRLLVDSGLSLIFTLVPIIFLHECVHGLFFYLFSGQAAQFGMGPGYAFASAPKWYFPKSQYLVIGLSPFFLLTSLVLVAASLLPATWAGAALGAAVLNAAGSIGDLYVCWRIAREAGEVWVKDTGDGFQVYSLRVG